MAEIRSTLDMVMERAAQLCDTSDNKSDSQDCSKDGMRTGAAYLRGDNIIIAQEIANIAPAAQPSFIKGIIDTFLRNLVLPREEEVNCEDALTGLLEVGKACHKEDNLANLITEVRTVMARYIDHKKQLRQQLEENFAAQMGQMEDNLAQQTGMAMKLAPSQHPQFAKEWQNIQVSMNDQYGNALAQYKAAITQQLMAS